MSSNRNDDLEKLIGILRSFDTCMLISRGVDEEIRARPMAMARIENDLKLWFVTSIESDQVGEFLNDSHAAVTAQNDHSAYLTLTGRAHAIQNSDIARELWSSSFDTWFPKGPTDPDLALIEFEAQRGEYWDARGMKKIVYALEVAKAYVTGNPPKLEQGVFHAKVDID